MTKYADSPALASVPLGKTTEYKSEYDPSLLHGVPRSLNRDDLELGNTLPFHGEDIWTGYELSWLNANGKPIVALAKFSIPFDSECLIESKSFKLYLNSFNQTKFDSHEQVQQTIAADLSNIAKAPVQVEIFGPNDLDPFAFTPLPGESIDELDISIEDYEFQPNYLENAAAEITVEETLHSHLLKSNCLITSQPDWGSVIIEYKGPQINREALLRYLISFRQHNEFHEQCVERIFTDIMKFCHPTELSVFARYTRRGGLDINPYRTNTDKSAPNIRTNRQ